MDSKTLCLAVLLRGGASGYEIKKALESPPLSHFQDTGFGSIYPALNRLTQEGLAEVEAQAQERRPDKKVYSLTESGRAALMEALMEPPGPDRYRSDFLFVLTFAELLPAATLLQVLDERIAFYDTALGGMTACGCQAEAKGHRLVHGYGLAVYGAARDYLKAERAKLAEGPRRAVAK